MNRLRLRTGQDFLKPRIAPQWVPFPTCPQVGKGDAVIGVVDSKGSCELTLDFRDGSVDFSGARALSPGFSQQKQQIRTRFHHVYTRIIELRRFPPQFFEALMAARSSFIRGLPATQKADHIDKGRDCGRHHKDACLGSELAAVEPGGAGKRDLEKMTHWHLPAVACADEK